MTDSNLMLEFDELEQLYLIYQRNVHNDTTDIIGSLHKENAFRKRNKRENKQQYAKKRALYDQTQVWVLDLHVDALLFVSDIQLILENLKVLNNIKEVLQ